MPTFDWANIFRGIKAIAVRAAYSNVAKVIAIATLVGGVMASISAVVTVWVIPTVDLSGIESIEGLLSPNTGYGEIAKYIFRLDLITDFIKFWSVVTIAIFTFSFTSLLALWVGFGVIKVKEALAKDIKETF